MGGHGYYPFGLIEKPGSEILPPGDKGRFAVTDTADDEYVFRAAPLRNIALTAPYMHDGSVATLEDVLDIYQQGGRQTREGAWPGDGRLHPAKSNFVKGFDLTAEERAAVLAFLQSLTDPHFITNPAYADPWPASPAAGSRSQP